MNAAPAISGSKVYPSDIEPARLELWAMRVGEALVAWSHAHRTRRSDAVVVLTAEDVSIRRAAQIEAQEALDARYAAGSRSHYQAIR